MKERSELPARITEIHSIDKHLEATVPPPLNYGVESGDDELRLRDYWHAVRKRLWLIIGIAALITVLAAVYLARKPDIYDAQARVQVDLENANPALSTSKSAVVFNYHINDPAYFNTQLQILTGPGLLRRVVRTLDLDHNPNFFRPQAAQTHSTWQSLRRLVGLGDKDKDPKAEADDQVPLAETVAPAASGEDLAEAKRLAPYVKALQLGLRVEPVKDTRLTVKDTRLIDVHFTHSDPQIAAKIVNAVADVFARSNLEKKTETNTATGEYLAKRIAELQAQIREDNEKLVNYGEKHQFLSLSKDQDIVVERLAGLNSQLLVAENEREQAQAAYEAIQGPGAAEAIAETDAKQISDAETKLQELRQQRAELLVDNTEEWPEVKVVEQKIAELEQQVEAIRNRAVAIVKTNRQTAYQQALKKEEALRNALNAQRALTLTQNEAAINYRIIQQEIDTNTDLLNGLLQRSKENEVVVAGTPNNIHVVDHAITPDMPVGPKRFQGVMLALALSSAFGIGLALFLEYLDDTVRSTDDVEKTLRLPALAVIPSTSLTSRRRLLPAFGALQSRNGNGNGHNAELLVNANARSPLAEAYRQLRTSVLLSTAGHAPKTLLVTSSVPAEGKTTTAVNVALSLAQTGASVLVIDADMRRPRIHKIFSLENRGGLSTILSSEMSEAEVLTLVNQDAATGIYVLPSGAIPPNPAELLGSDQMRSLIATLESTFTHIVIDSPPIASFTDGVLISTMVDGTLLVVHGGKSSRSVVRRSRQLLIDVGAKIFGVVLNNVNIHSGDYYYYYQRYYQQSYYKTEPEDDHLAADVQG